LSSPNFIDYVKICARSGKGGTGSSHFRKEKFVPKGGPDGGDGGRGGHIILRGSTQNWTLLHLKYRKHVVAGNGGNGEGGNRTGKQGADIVLDVPLGTIAKREESNEVVFEITENGQEEILLDGGMGGLGNTNFKSPVNQAPMYAQPGIEGQEVWFILELKMLADVGLVGFPNAGKSTLLSVISEAKPKIANYAFTTITPNVGVVPYRDFKSFVVADIPGIIEGAAEGKGMGTRFLRHIERNSVLLFLVPADAMDINKDYKILLDELKKYNPELLDKKRILGISKCDLLDEELLEELKKEVIVDLPKVFFSSISQFNLQELKDSIWKEIN
jgi:GTP-binding protein